MTVQAPATSAVRALATLADPGGPVAEAFRNLRATLIQGRQYPPLHALLLCGADGRADAAIAAANLAVVLAQLGKRVALVDADLRSPQLHRLWQLERNTGGLSGALQAEAPAPALHDVGVAGLAVLTAGPAGSGTADLLAGPRMAALLAALRTAYDYVVVVTAPLLTAADAISVAPHVDGVALVIQAGASKHPAVRQAVLRLEGVHAHLLGAIMTQVRPDRGFLPIP